jgi:cobyrinic acid a,c-diamide synthase
MGARLVIAGTQSGVGKTTLTVGLIAALRDRGLRVQPFKVGPDYIDPSHHTLAAGLPSRNLDTWMLPPERVRSSFLRAAAEADVAIVEGVMGLFDGAGYDDESGSTAEVAKLLQAPVVLILDVSKLARSAGAMALGYRCFDDGLRLAGFIVNCAAGEGHGRGVSAAIARATGLPVLGWLPRVEALGVPERHLGLVPATEPGQWNEFVRAAGEAVRRHIDIDGLLAIADQAPALPQIVEDESNVRARLADVERPVIAVARDEAFHFTYEDNLDLLRAAGATVAFFSPLRDRDFPPATAGVILSGGFPEVYASGLSANQRMHAAVRAAHSQGVPIYAECGGLMYLTQAIVEADGCRHEMAGLLPGHSVMSDRLTLGYRLARAAGPSWLLPEGATVRGHEFHYSKWVDRAPSLPPAYVLLPRSGAGEPQPEGARLGSLWASYVHLNFGALPELASRFVAAARRGVAGGVP